MASGFFLCCRRVLGRLGGDPFSNGRGLLDGVLKVMVSKILKCGAVLACGVLLLGSLPAPADQAKGDTPVLSGTWGKKDGEMKIVFADTGILKIAPHGDRAPIAVVCNYTVVKEGWVDVEITGYEGEDEVKKKIAAHAPVGLKFRFRWTVKGDAARLDDLAGDNVETLKAHLEGDFEQTR
jgi:hypothetical protein